MILFFSTTNAQENYNDLWEKVQRLEVENLPKSALKIVDDIYAKAEKNNNAPQIVKTLFYKSKFGLVLEEDAQLKIINDFKSHINKSEFPTKNVLENVLANLYWQYFNQNRWKFYQRTKTSKKVDTTDFRTWDLDTLFEEIHTYYKSSLKEKLLLQKVDVHQFKDILHVVKGSKEFRPTLFDFLAHNALQFYKTSENNTLLYYKLKRVLILHFVIPCNTGEAVAATASLNLQAFKPSLFNLEFSSRTFLKEIICPITKSSDPPTSITTF